MFSQALLALGSCRIGSDGEQVVSIDQALPLAAHIVALRVGYTHHGIYVGDGRVLHYAGLSPPFRRGPVMEVSLAEFSRSRPVRVLSHSQGPFTSDEVIARARSRLGEDCYRLLSNNCEHFCEWCIGGESRSRQIEMWRMRTRYLLRAAWRLYTRLRLRRPAGRKSDRRSGGCPWPWRCRPQFRAPPARTCLP